MSDSENGRESPSEDSLEIREPKVGAIYTVNQKEGTANIWVRGTEDHLFGLIQRDDGSQATPTLFDLDSNLDYTGVVVVKCPDSAKFRVAVTNADEDTDACPHVLTEDNSIVVSVHVPYKIQEDISFFLACCRAGFLGTEFRASDAAYENAMTEKLDFAVMHGDQIYADPTKGNLIGEVTDFKGYCKRYRKAWGTSGMTKMMNSIATYMILDDHEVYDDFGGYKSLAEDDERWPRVRLAMRAYTAYQRRDVERAGKDKDKVWYTFEAGIHRFFVMDFRTQRDVENGTMLGLSQQNAVLRWLEEPCEGISFLVTSKPFAPDRTEIGDGWPLCQDERALILDACAKCERAPVFLGGDSHASMSASIFKEGREKPVAHSIVSSGIRSYVYRTPESFLMGKNDMSQGYYYQTCEGFVDTKSYAILSTKGKNKLTSKFYHRNSGEELVTNEFTC